MSDINKCVNKLWEKRKWELFNSYKPLDNLKLSDRDFFDCLIKQGKKDEKIDYYFEIFFWIMTSIISVGIIYVSYLVITKIILGGG